MKNRSPSPPLRTCVGCRLTRAKHELIRFRRGEEGGLEINLWGDKPGRGVYLCPRSSCISEAVKNNALSRSLKGIIRVETASGLEEAILLTLEGELNRLIPGGESLEREDEIGNGLIPAAPVKKSARAAELWYKYRNLKDN